MIHLMNNSHKIKRALKENIKPQDLRLGNWQLDLEIKVTFIQKQFSSSSGYLHFFELLAEFHRRVNARRLKQVSSRCPLKTSPAVTRCCLG